jgi:hypothetical protein
LAISTFFLEVAQLRKDGAMRRSRQQSVQSNNKENVNYTSCGSVSIAEEMVRALISSPLNAPSIALTCSFRTPAAGEQWKMLIASSMVFAVFLPRECSVSTMAMEVRDLLLLLQLVVI